MLESEITDIAHDVWESLFGTQLTPGGSAHVAHPSLTSVVHIEGAWHGAVSVHCPIDLAESLATRLFGECDDADVRDLLGEAANQLGGNIKALLPAPSSLSLPTVTTGSDYDLQVMQTTTAARLAFRCEGQPVVVSLLAGAS